ncbi:MAG: ORF6N domain-containing protein [Parcubacteria group bacterium]
MEKIMPISPEIIQQKIYFIRGEKVMFDRDLAELYGVETKALNRAVRRNVDRFPADFMFQVNEKEAKILRYQFGTLEMGKYSKYLPYVFTEQGVAMLSSVLKSERAIKVNIQIIRTFTQIRKMLVSHKDLRGKLEIMEQKYDKQFRVVFETLKLLLKEDEKPKKRIGFGG